MAERSSIFQVVQVGLEVTPGVAVPATKKLLATSFEIGPSPEVSIFKPNGYKYPTVASLNKEWVEGSIEGLLTYTDIVYLLSSLINADTAEVIDTTGYEWVFSSDSDGADAPVTFTVEQGSAERAHEFAYCLVTGLSFSFSEDGAEIGGSVMGSALDDGITLTPAATEVALEPVTRPQVLIYLADTYAGLDGATAEPRVLSVEWSLTDRYNPLWVLNGSTSFAAHTEAEPSSEVTLLMEADADGMAPLQTMRDGDTLFVRIEATGPVIGAGPATYSLTIDSAIKIEDVSDFQDEQGVFAIEWTGRLAHDATWGKAFEIRVVNGLATL